MRFGEHESINSVHNRAIRMFLGVHRFAPISAITGDMGWVPSKIRRFVNMFRFWNRLIKMNDNRLTKKIFQWDKSFSRNCLMGNSTNSVPSVTFYFLNNSLSDISRKCILPNMIRAVPP